MYRIYLNDAIYFRKNITANLEHGPVNDKNGQYHSICFYYWQNDTMFSLTDSIDIGNIASESAHQFKIYGQSSLLSINSSFEGSFDKIILNQNGRVIKDSVEFMAKIQAKNKGVRLLRTFDYSFKNQTADIFVNDKLVGTWLIAGSNPIQQFRDDYFTIPAIFTQNESQIKVKIIAKNNWASLNYKVFTLLDKDSVYTNINDKSSQLSIQLYPNPASELINIVSDQQLIKTLNIYRVDGTLLQSHQVNDFRCSLNIHQLPKGMYISEIITDTNNSISKKFIVE